MLARYRAAGTEAPLSSISRLQAASPTGIQWKMHQQAKVFRSGNCSAGVGGWYVDDDGHVSDDTGFVYNPVRRIAGVRLPICRVLDCDEF